MSNTGLSQRMAKFNQAFKNILGPKRQGYSEAGTLEQPLVSSHAQSDDEYYRQHGVSRPGAAPFAQQQQTQLRTQGVAEGMAYGDVTAAALPDDVRQHSTDSYCGLLKWICNASAYAGRSMLQKDDATHAMFTELVKVHFFAKP